MRANAAQAQAPEWRRMSLDRTRCTVPPTEVV